MQKPTVIVSGKNGQLGKELQYVANSYPQFHFLFFARDELNISNADAVDAVIKKYKPAYFINTAAYTGVDKAETDQSNAYQVNAESPGIIAKACKLYQTTLIHISTDYVFDGNGRIPYKEDTATNPVNYYGFTKLEGERLALINNNRTIIIRTSWVYSIYGNNFVKTMLRLMNERKEVNVVNDQFGSPTFAKDLADSILKIVTSCQSASIGFRENYYGIYHFSNEGIISWYEFAVAIRDLNQLNCSVHPVSTAQFSTIAKRPAFSVLSKEKIQTTFNIKIKDWKVGLQECLDKL